MKIGDLIREDAVGAWHLVEEAPVEGTLRILRKDHVGDEAATLVFLEELRRIKTLDHPGLIRVLHHEASGDRPWILTEPIDGRSLADEIRSNGPLGEAEALALADQLLDTLSFLESRRQVHAVPVPERMLRVRDRWKLSTFRDIRAWDELKTLKGKKHPLPAYAPPERARAHRSSYSPQAHNAWHVGALLRFTLGGGPPLDEAGKVLGVPSAMPEALATAVARLTAPNPELRAQGAHAVRRVLSGEGSGQATEGPAARTAPPLKAPVPRKRRRPRP